MKDSLWETSKALTEPETPAWELFHENAKTGHYDKSLSNEQVLAQMDNLYESFPYNNFPLIPLPESFANFESSLLETIINRKTPTEIQSGTLSLEQLRTILYCGYGITRDNTEDSYINRPFRTVPSGGALYPLELYFYTAGGIDGLAAGIYHYTPTKNGLQLIKPGNFDQELEKTLVDFQRHLVAQTTLLIFITAAFNRSIFKYRDKGYRFCMLEAGHVAQNINLAATALNQAVINIGGYHDRLIDRFLHLDGLNQSTIYINGIGANG